MRFVRLFLRKGRKLSVNAHIFDATQTTDNGKRETLVLGFELTLSAVIVSVADEEPRLLCLKGKSPASLPNGPVSPGGQPTLELALRSRVMEQTGATLGYVEQLYTFGDRFRDPREVSEGVRPVSVAYLALVKDEQTLEGSRWLPWYGLFPWEDWRCGAPDILAAKILPRFEVWLRESRGDLGANRRERVELAFGQAGASWDREKVLERYELLYEAGFVEEAKQDVVLSVGQMMALDHRRILATAMARLRGKITYRPVIFELLPNRFTLNHLQRVVEALGGVRVHKQNFRRLVDKHGLVERTGCYESKTGGRPAELFVFRREVLRERPAPGVGLPRA